MKTRTQSVLNRDNILIKPIDTNQIECQLCQHGFAIKTDTFRYG